MRDLRTREACRRRRSAWFLFGHEFLRLMMNRLDRAFPIGCFLDNCEMIRGLPGWTPRPCAAAVLA